MHRQPALKKLHLYSLKVYIKKKFIYKIIYYVSGTSPFFRINLHIDVRLFKYLIQIGIYIN